MRIVPLEIGRLETKLTAITGEPGTVVLPEPAWLVEHPDGLILFDTGLHSELQHSTDRIGERLGAVFSPDLPADELLGARLDQRGVGPTDIDRIVFSHLHFDHCGGTAEVGDARIVVQRDEWVAAHRPELIEAGAYNPDDFDIGHDVQLIEGHHDVFADGTVMCIPTPGHTAGHQSLRVELESGPVVLTADCIYFEHFLDEMIVPSFGHDLDRQRRSMRELAALRAQGCRLLFGHDAAQFASLPVHGLT
ncbi:MAG: N-acyl homoserine lactonase family protein [Acidimicrobiia bacterium]|nr:N-acyl homoserine lactonase family protein [Acidimicrobiia bacterium]